MYNRSINSGTSLIMENQHLSVFQQATKIVYTRRNNVFTRQLVLNQDIKWGNSMEIIGIGFIQNLSQF